LKKTNKGIIWRVLCTINLFAMLYTGPTLALTTDVDITDRAIQVRGARECQSFVLKVLHLNFGKLPLLHIADPSVKSMCTIKQTK
jgi:hypothetical protein